MSLAKQRAIVFVHYDKHSTVDEYVYTYLKELQKNSSYLIFISTAQLSPNDIDTIAKYSSSIIVKENVGYDFMSYKIGLENFDYTQYDEVIICNDSVYGPVYPLNNTFKVMQNSNCDFWGMTNNRDIHYHLQSYFLVFKKKVINSDVFKNFWEQVQVLHDKNEIIQQYEIGLSQTLITHGFKPYAFATIETLFFQKIKILLSKLTPSKIRKKLISIINDTHSLKRIEKINATHYLWKELLVVNKMPFIKIELLRDNPKNINIDDIYKTIQEVSEYDASMIKKHLARMKAPNNASN